MIRKSVIFATASICIFGFLAFQPNSSALEPRTIGPLHYFGQLMRVLVETFAPPEISYSLSCDASSVLDLEMVVEDDVEIAYYAIQQQGGDPPVNVTVYAEPGSKMEEYSITLDISPDDRLILLIASDIFGNTTKELVEVPADVCVQP